MPILVKRFPVQLDFTSRPKRSPNTLSHLPWMQILLHIQQQLKPFVKEKHESLLDEPDNRTEEEKILLTYQLTWEEIANVVNMIDCEQVYIAFDGVAPAGKGVEQRKRRYIRPLPEDGQFDLTNISCGTEFMHNLCSFIQFKIQETNWNKKVVFSSHTVPGEGEAKCMTFLRQFPMRTRVCVVGPDGDLIMLALASPQDFYVFKVDYRTANTNTRQYYTIHTQILKEDINKWNKDHFKRQVGFIDHVKSFLFLSNFLGNDFCRRIEIFDLFINGIDDMYNYYQKIHFSLIENGRLDKRTFSNLLRLLAQDEPKLLAKRTKNPFPLLEKHMKGIEIVPSNESKEVSNKQISTSSINKKTLNEKETTNKQPASSIDEKRENPNELGTLDFKNFRLEYYKEFVGIATDVEIEKMCLNYLDTIWWCWIYYTRGCPSWTHVYRYHYPPFCIDLYNASLKWRIPKFENSRPRRPFEQLLAILPPNRKKFLPVEYHGLMKGEMFPKVADIKSNSQGKNPMETVYEIPLYESNVTIYDSSKYNRVTSDRVFIPGEEKYKVKTSWGKCTTTMNG